jgi:aldose 1-epimerase
MLTLAAHPNLCQHIYGSAGWGGNAVAFQVRQETRPNSIGRDPTIWILEDDSGSRLEVWPAMGFNAYRWTVGGEELLYRDPAFFDEVKPTRSGWPILFPFPNRIRDGRFTWSGKEYQLPKNDPSGKNAIHGFVASRPWRVVDHRADVVDARLTAEFESVRDGSEVVNLWPGAFRLRVAYRLLGRSHLRVEATVENPGAAPLPFGLGYHPYFRVAPFGGEKACIEIEGGKQWKLEDNLPTGATAAFSQTKHERRFAEVQLDHLFTDVPISRHDTRQCGSIESEDGRRLVVEAGRDFRELVVFTPPHRQAICFEPYTCITDAINLQQQGVDSGLYILAPGEIWHGWVQAWPMEEPTTAA